MQRTMTVQMKTEEEEATTNENQCDHTIKNKRILMPINSNEPKKTHQHQKMKKMKRKK